MLSVANMQCKVVLPQKERKNTEVADRMSAHLRLLCSVSTTLASCSWHIEKFLSTHNAMETHASKMDSTFSQTGQKNLRQKWRLKHCCKTAMKHMAMYAVCEACLTTNANSFSTEMTPQSLLQDRSGSICYCLLCVRHVRGRMKVS